MRIGCPSPIYDVEKNEGYVYVGISNGTPGNLRFARSSSGGRMRGGRVYPIGSELLILADSGGGNGLPRTGMEPKPPGEALRYVRSYSDRLSLSYGMFKVEPVQLHQHGLAGRSCRVLVQLTAQSTTPG
jgi:hypothetical protein